MRVRRRKALSRPRARPRGRAPRLAGKRAGSPQLAPTVGEGQQEAFGTCHSRRERGDFRAAVAFLPLSFADRSVSSPRPPPRYGAPRRGHAPSLQPGPAPRTQLWPKLFPPPPERGAAPRAGAGNSRGLSGGTQAESAAPPSTSPGRAGVLGPARARLPEWGRGGPRLRSRGIGGGWIAAAGREPDDRGASQEPLGELGEPAPPHPGPRPLAVSASLPHTPPGPPEPRPSRRFSSFSSHSPLDPVVLLSAGLAPSGASPRSQALLKHTSTPRSLGGLLLLALLLPSSLTPPSEED